MTRSFRWIAVAAVLVLAAAGGFGGWLFARHSAPPLPEISVFAHRHSISVGPFVYCNVVNLNDCQNPQTQGELKVTELSPVQLSVPSQISEAPWRLLRVYEDPRNSTERFFRPGSQTAVTIPADDPHRGRLTGIVVQLLTLVRDPAGELHETPHAEWSVRIVWS